MAQIKSIEFKQESISLLFGARWYRNAKAKLNFKSFDEIPERISDFDVEFIAELLLAAHENASFFKKSDMVVSTVDDFLLILDEIGLIEAANMITQSMLDLSGYDRLNEAEKAKLVEQGQQVIKKNKATK